LFFLFLNKQMSVNTVSGSSIPSSINNDNNTTRVMEVDTLYATIITDSIATIENGYITNLIEPTTDNEIATKYYVDNSSSGGGATGPNGSIQYNDASTFAGSANLTITNPGLSSETLNINGTLTNGTMSLVGSQFSGLINPTSGQQAATKNYVDQSVNKLETITVNVEQNFALQYTPTQVYNKIINITMDPNNILAFCPIDLLPTAVDMKTFLGSEFTIGKSWITILDSPQTGNDLFVRYTGAFQGEGIVFSPLSNLYCSLVLPTTTGVNYTRITLFSLVTNITSGSEQYYTYVISPFNDLDTDAQITDQGVLTPSMGNGSILDTIPGSVIYPVPNNPALSSSSPLVYTHANLKQYLIVRTGLTANTADTFVAAAVFVTSSDFTMGGGTLKFFIQNPTAYDLTLTPSAGWSFQAGNSNIIPAGYCGAFWVTVIISPASCKIYSLSINPING